MRIFCLASIVDRLFNSDLNIMEFLCVLASSMNGCGICCNIHTIHIFKICIISWAYNHFIRGSGIYMPFNSPLARLLIQNLYRQDVLNLFFSFFISQDLSIIKSLHLTDFVFLHYFFGPISSQFK